MNLIITYGSVIPKPASVTSNGNSSFTDKYYNPVFKNALEV
jgi:hypothetical protein